MPLGNYRDVPFNLGGMTFQVGGFRRPDGVGAFQELQQNHGVTDVISLDGNHQANFSAAGLAGGYHSGAGFAVHDHFDAPYETWNRIDPQIYDNIYREVMQAASAGRKVAIHCGAGDGRTGTALSSLMLRQLLESEYATNPAAIGGAQKTSLKIHMHHGVNGHEGGNVAVTPLVKQAIEQVRGLANPGPHGSSVESRNDVESLMQYERKLRVEFAARYELESVARVEVRGAENENETRAGQVDNQTDAEVDDILLQIEAATDALDQEPQATEGFVSSVVQSIQRIYQRVCDFAREAAEYVSNMIASR